MFLMSLALAAAHITVAYRASCRERRRLLVYRIDIEAIPIRVFERFWRTIEAYACRPFTGHDNGQKNTTSPHARKAMVERWPADEGGTRHCRFLPPLAAAQGAKKATAESVRSMRSSATRHRSRPYPRSARWASKASAASSSGAVERRRTGRGWGRRKD
ncbi:uncharacterized protein LOC127759983 [Oryza glaberrima]|uniref:uncharacterized protein LOC127759983 n=1 Tax=Oryza glaberrima TaxID=4538 RepID=UPI00224C197A|nr:uncharacterized protein LOC127759983 [Oryza glaberrima]